MTGRLSYKNVLGSKNPADTLTKNVPGELLDKHLETLGAEAADGRADAAPELCSVESRVQWCRDESAEDARSEGEEGQRKPVQGKCVRFARKVQFRAVEHANEGRRCSDRSLGRSTRRTSVPKAGQRWADFEDGEDQGYTAEDLFLSK